MTQPTTPQAAPARWTINAIKAAYEDAKPDGGGHYFDRATLRFFGQRVSSFKVIHSGERVFIVAPSKHGGYSIREFIPTTAALKPVDDITGMALVSRSSTPKEARNG